jgi:hypothetical protein
VLPMSFVPVGIPPAGSLFAAILRRRAERVSDLPARPRLGNFRKFLPEMEFGARPHTRRAHGS